MRTWVPAQGVFKGSAWELLAWKKKSHPEGLNQAEQVAPPTCKEPPQ